MATKTYVSKKPSGLSIKRNVDAVIFEWKLPEHGYGKGLIAQYRYTGGTWQTLSVGGYSSKTHITVPRSSFFPYTAKKLDKIYFRIRGTRNNFSEDGDYYVTSVSPWASKEYIPDLPYKPTLTAALSDTYSNVTTFTWSTTTTDDTPRWFTSVQCQTCLLKASTITDGAKVPASAWTAYSATAASGSATITEDSSTLATASHTRWFRVRACGPKGPSEWTYAKHIYAVPFQASNVKATTRKNSSGGYVCSLTWNTPRNAAKPVDKINVQYTFTTPTATLGCPDSASWTDAQTLAYRDGSDATSFSIDSSVSYDQCLFVRVNTVHDRNTTYGAARLVVSGGLTDPSNLSVEMDSSNYTATVTVTNNCSVPGSFLIVKYMTTKNPNGFNVGIIPNGDSSVTVQCPSWSSTSYIKFGVMAVVGTYTATTRADGVSSYAVSAWLRSSIITYGGTVPAAPTSVTLKETSTPGTVRVTFNWPWSAATAAELSWADHSDAWESTDGPSTYMIDNTHASAWNICGLDIGKVWYVRVRLASGSGDSQVFSGYSTTKSIELTEAPAAPLVTLEKDLIRPNGWLPVSWTYDTSDGTRQAYAEVAEVDNGVYKTVATAKTAKRLIFSAKKHSWTAGNTYSLAVRVTSNAGKRSAWSEPVTFAVANALTATISSTSLVQQTITDDDDLTRTVSSLTALPLTVTVTGAGAGGITRLAIERAETYHMLRPDERDYNGFEGETVFNYSQVGQSAISIDLDDLIGHLDDGAEYRLVATVQDGFGQSATAKKRFEVHWSHQALIPTATVTVDTTNLVTQITPVAPDGAISTDKCDIYRLSVDRPELIYPDAAFGTTYVDPYPTIGEHGGYRIVFKTANGDYITSDNIIAWTDYKSELDSDFNVINFGTGRVMLEYDIDLSHTWAKDFTETKYLGGSVQGDWNPAASRTGTMSANVIPDDAETIEAMRRLAVYPGICHIRTKDGSSYPADVQVAESSTQDTAHKIVAFSLTITRVDTEDYDGMTLAEWQETEGE